MSETAAARPAAEETASPFSFRDFNLVFATRILSTSVNQGLAVAVGWQVYDLTGSAFDLGLIGLVQFIATFCFVIPGGQAADLYDRRKILLVCYAIEFGAIAGLVPVTLYADDKLPWIYGLLLLNSVARAFEPAALQSMVATVLPRPLVSRGIAGFQAAARAATILAPVMAGLLYVLGPETVYGFGATLLLFGIGASLSIRVSNTPDPNRKVSWDTALAGFRYIGGRKPILGAITLDLFAELFGGATALLPIFAHDFLQLGPWGLGMLRSAPAAGAILVGILLARRPIKRHAGRVMLCGVALYAVATIGFAFSHDLVLSLIALALSGCGDMFSMVIRHSLIQVNTPDAMRGRVTAVNGLFTNTSYQLGEFESGVTASMFGPVGSVLFGGAATLALVAIWAWKFPALRRIDRLDQPIAD